MGVATLEVLPSKVRGDEAGQTIEREAGVVLVVAGYVLADHVGGQHDDVQTLME